MTTQQSIFDPTTTIETGARSAPLVSNAAVHAIGLGAVLMSGGIFGIFVAWICTTMWGLDAADPRVAIAAMQEMNESVRNPLFFGFFFLSPVALAGAAAVAALTGRRPSATRFAAAAVVLAVGCVAVTAAFSVPMNRELADIVVPASEADARLIWEDYSGRWQVFNAIRSAFCGVALALAANGLRLTGRG